MNRALSEESWAFSKSDNVSKVTNLFDTLEDHKILSFILEYKSDVLQSEVFDWKDKEATDFLKKLKASQDLPKDFLFYLPHNLYKENDRKTIAQKVHQIQCVSNFNLREWKLH